MWGLELELDNKEIKASLIIKQQVEREEGDEREEWEGEENAMKEMKER